MADAMAEMADTRSKGRKGPLLIGGVLAILLGAGGFFAAQSGLVGGPGKQSGDAAAPKIAFVPLPAVMLTLPQGSDAKFLRMTAQIEVAQDRVEEVAGLTPRILDVLNGYLRAVDTRDLASPPAFIRLRAQMLRRIQMVVGPDRVRDLLITEFVIN